MTAGTGPGSGPGSGAVRVGAVRAGGAGIPPVPAGGAVNGLTPELPGRAPYVVVGAGVHGLSAAYHLAEELDSRGRSGREVVVLDKSHVGAGASGISGGIVRNFYLSPAMAELVRRSVGLFEVDPSGFGYREVGYVAAVPEAQVGDLERIAAQHAAVGYRSDLILGAEAAAQHMRSIYPDWIATEIEAVLHERQGGWADATATLANLAGMARSLGVRILEGVEVVGFDITAGAVDGIETSAGWIGCDVTVVAPGPWAAELAHLLDLAGDVAVWNGDEVVRRPLVSFLQIREAEVAVRRVEELLPPLAPVVHVDHAGPLVSERHGTPLHEGPWGIYFRPGLRGGAAAGGLPVTILEECAIDPYGPPHPVWGAAGEGFDDFLASGLAATLRRFEGRGDAWRIESYGALGAFTPDNYPLVDFVRSNALALFDSSHGFKALELGRLAALEILDGPQELLGPFRFARFGVGDLHPASHGPYPWT